MSKADEALKRFEARQAEKEEAPGDENEAPLDAADIVAEELDVQPDIMQIPPGIVRGVIVYEREDGSFGYDSLVGGPLIIMDAILLGTRLVEGARADLHAQTTIKHLKAQAQKSAAPQPVRVARPMGRRTQ